MKTCLIITGGDFDEFVPEEQFEYVIACDKGFEYAKRMSITPDVIIGDFDSSKEPCDSSIPVIKAPKEKDDTDTMLAIRHALDKGFRHITILCGLGKRFDHTLSNIQSAAFVAKAGGICEIIGSDERIRTLTASDGTLILPADDKRSLSVFSLSDECRGLTIKGSAYDCSDITLRNTFPLGQSNAFRLDEVSIKIQSGIALIVNSAL